MFERIQQQMGPFPGDFMSLESLQTFLVPFEWKNLKFRIKKAQKHIRSNVLNSSEDHLLIVFRAKFSKQGAGKDCDWSRCALGHS